jgi:hypothetical protein
MSKVAESPQTGTLRAGRGPVVKAKVAAAGGVMSLLMIYSVM